MSTLPLTAPSTGQLPVPQPLLPVRSNNNMVVAFISLQAVGFVGSCIVLATALLGRKVKRDATWISFAISFIIWSFTYMLLFIAGQEFRSEPFDLVTCTAQAALVYAVPVLTSFTTVALGVELLFRIRWAIGKSAPVAEGMARTRRRYYVGIPWAAYLLVIGESLTVVGSTPGSGVEIESGIYCGIVNKIPGHLSASLVVASMLVLLGILGWAFKLLYPVWSSVDDHGETLGSDTLRPIFLRLVIFTLLALSSAIFGVFFVISQKGPMQDTANIFIAILPIGFCFIFGFQKDMRDTWAFWRKPSPSLPKDARVSIILSDQILAKHGLPRYHGDTPTTYNVELPV